MPTPFMCHECDKPTMNRNGICDDCHKNDVNKQDVVSTISDVLDRWEQEHFKRKRKGQKDNE